MKNIEIKNNWTETEVKEIYFQPLIELIRKASEIHSKFHKSRRIYVGTLISLKTGLCEEDCAYCAQSARYNTEITPHNFMSIDEAYECAKKAKENGATRVCLSASWRDLDSNEKYFDLILQIGRKIRENLNLKVCCTLGMISKEKASILKKEGFFAYNHNLDTSENFYETIITTHTYQDRLKTIENLIDVGMRYCSGGIIGMGEKEDDRIKLLHTLATRKVHPYSIPLNCLIPIKGTPLEKMPIVNSWEIIRMIATARILMPKSYICLAAGRTTLNDEAHALCYLAGANSIFIGEKLLTTANVPTNKDFELFNILGLINC